MHSPFVYELITQVWVPENQFYAFHKLKSFRQSLFANHTRIPQQDFGAGSAVLSRGMQPVSRIARVAGQTQQGLFQVFRLAQHMKVTSVLELGTSVGMSAAAFALLGDKVRVHSIEGNEALAAFASSEIGKLELTNCTIHAGTFEHVLPQVIAKNGPFDLVYIDGNHREQPTLDYWNQVADQLPPNGLVIFDDIHWSKEMSSAWFHIQQDPRVTLSLDLYRFGVVFVNPAFSKEQFLLRVGT